MSEKIVLREITYEQMSTLVTELKTNNFVKDKEIERLKKREQECIDHYLVQCKYASEMEGKYITANNIINELEKDIDLELYKTRANDEYNKGLFNAFRYVKDKLQELKGEDKE